MKLSKINFMKKFIFHLFIRKELEIKKNFRSKESKNIILTQSNQIAKIKNNLISIKNILPQSQNSSINISSPHSDTLDYNVRKYCLYDRTLSVNINLMDPFIDENTDKKSISNLEENSAMKVEQNISGPHSLNNISISSSSSSVIDNKKKFKKKRNNFIDLTQLVKVMNKP